MMDNAASCDQLAPLFKAMGDPQRLDILRVLARDALGVLELTAVFQCPQSRISHHLKWLAQAGLLTTRREGNSIFYRRAHRPPASVSSAFWQALWQNLDRFELKTELADGLAKVEQARAASSQRFFAEHSEAFRAQQELIAHFGHYAEATLELMPEPDGPYSTALEVGPGEGAFLPHLSQRFARVVALDSATEMLSKAEQLCQRQQLDNVELWLGDSRDPRLEGQRFQLILLQMVLHHVPSPASMLADLAPRLQPGGTLLICDLCSHDQSWAKTACGDLWLGFEPDELRHWGRQAGLQPGRASFHAQRNGFRLQVHEFINAAGPDGQ